LDCNITESQQFGDPYTKQFFLRIAATAEGQGRVLEPLRAAVADLALELGGEWQVHDADVRQRVLVLVSKEGHCLNDLLYRWRSGLLPVEIVAVASNHPDLAPLADAVGVPFHHFPITPTTRAD